MKKILLLLLTVALSMPLMLNAQFTATFGTGTSTSQTGGSAGSPMSSGAVYSYTQNIYTAAELTAANVPAGATIIALEFSNGTGENVVMENCHTYMGHRSTTSFTSATDYTPFNQLTFVDSSNWVSTGLGWFTVNLTTPFTWDGTSNLLVAVTYGGAVVGDTNCGYNYTAQSESRHWRRGCRITDGPVDAEYASHADWPGGTSPSGGAFTTPPAVSANRPNLRITYILSGCPSLTPTVANIGPYSADLSWINFQQSALNWDLMYGETGTFDTLSGGSTLTNITDTFYTLTGLSSATTYSVYLKSYCSSETGSWSSPRTFTTPAACPTPTNLVLMSHTAEEATISWMPGATESSWEVVCVPHGDPVYSGTPTVVYNSPYTFTNLIDNTPYDIYVRAECGNGEYSYWTSAVTFTTDPYCTEPTNLTVSQVQGSSALVTWNSAPVGATGYTVGYSEAGQGNWTTVPSVTGTSFMISGLTTDTDYDVFVLSECDQGDADTVYATFHTKACLVGGDLEIGNGTSTSGYFPEYCLYNYSYTQQIYLATEMGGPGNISSIAFDAQSIANANRHLMIYLMHTSAASGDWLSASNAQLVYDSTPTLTTGWNTFNFTTPFQYNGTDNLAVIVIDATGSWSGTNYFYTHNTNQALSHYIYQDSAPYSISTIPSSGTSSTSNSRNNVIFGVPCDSTSTCAVPNVYIDEFTDETVTLNWAPGYTETSWELEYSEDGSTWTSEGTVSTSPYIISNLTSNTLYYIRLRAICGGGDYSEWTSTSVRTACADMVTLPFMENFDSYTGATTTSVSTNNLPYCWSYLNEGTSTSYSGYPIIYASATYANSGTNSIRFYTYTTAGTYDDQIAILPPIDTDVNPMNTLQLALDARALSTSYTFSLDVGIMTDPTDRNTFVTMQNLQLTSTAYANYEIPFAQYQGTGKYIALRAAQPTSGYNYGYVDNVRVELIPECPKPTNVTSTVVTTNSVTLNWTEVGTATSWVVTYGPTGFTPGSSVAMTETVYSLPYTVTGLSASTNYDFYVQSECGSGNLSTMSNVYTVATECDIVTVLPLMQNFDNMGSGTSAYPNCWLRHNTYSTGPYPYISTTYASSGNASLYFYCSTSTYNIAVLPHIDENLYPVNTLQISFKMRSTSSTTTGLQVGVMTDSSNVSSFQALTTVYNTSTGTWQPFEIPLTNYTGSGHFIALKIVNSSSTYSAYVDDLVVELAPLCNKPTNVFASNITADGADIDWLPGGSETDWEVVLVPHGVSVTAGTPEPVSAHPYTLTNLTDNTSYDVYVRADCGTGTDYSSWSQVCTFTTTPLCSAPTNVTVSQVAGTSALLTWTEAVFGATGYTVAYTETGQNNWTTIPSVTGTSYMLSGLTPETPYTVTITSECAQGTAPVVTKTFTTHCLSGGEIAIGNGTTTSTYIPSYSFYNYGYSQQIFLASEMGGPTNITSISMNMSALSQQRNYKIYLAHTSQTNLSSGWASTTGAQKVFDSQQTLHTGWNTFDFTTPFAYNGTDNLLLIVRDSTGSYVSGNAWYTHSTPEVRARYLYQDGSVYPLEPASSTSGTTLTVRNNVIFGGNCDQTVTCIAPNVYVSDVTENSITLDWAPGNYESSWELETSTDNTTWTSQGTVTSAPYTLNNLTPSTLYYIRMRSDCGSGEYSNWIVVSERTECAPIASVPYIENFDTWTGATTTTVSVNNLPYCWSYLNAGTTTSYTGYPMVYASATYAASGNNSIRFYTYSTSGTYDDQIAILPAIDVNTLPMNTLQLSLDARNNSTYTFTLVVGIMTDPTNKLTFVPIDTIVTTSNTYANYEIPFGQYTGTGTYIALKAPRPATSYNSGYVDNVRVENIPSCPKPIQVHATNVSTTTVELGWTETGTATEWAVEYGPVGFMPGNGTVDVATTNPYTVSNLSASTQYDFYVRAVCGSGDTSNYTSALTVATSCDAIDQLPYTEGFDTYGTGETAYPNCWSKINTYSSNRPYVNSTNYAGVGSLYFYASSTTYNIAITPPFDATIPVNTLQATFMYRASSTSDYMIVGVMSNPTDASTFVPVDTVYPGSTASTWIEKEVLFNGYTGSGQYIAFYNGRPTGYNYSYIDDLVIEVIPTCPKPQNVTMVSSTVNSATIDWTENGPATSWTVEYGPTGYTAGTGTSSTATAHPYTITGLSASTGYDVYVRGDCGGGDLSPWSPVGHIFTACDAVDVLPYTEGFDSYGTGTTVYPNCWSKINTYTTADRPYVNSTHYAGVGSLYFYAGTSGTYNIAITPEFDASINISSLKANFMYRATYSTDRMIIGVMSSTTDASTFVPVDTVTPSTSSASTWVAKEVSFSNYSGTGHYIAFKNEYTSTYCYGYIDDLVISLDTSSVSDCNAPTALSVSGITPTTATATWTAGGSETSWNVQYKAASATNWTSATASTPSFTMSNLTPETQYQVRVQANCGGTTSVWTSAVSFTTLPNAQDPCNVPTGLHATDVGIETITIGWDAAASVSSWNIQYRPEGGQLSTASTQTNSYTLTGLTNSTTYQIQVQANCGDGNLSDWTQAINVTTTGIDSWLDNSVSLYPNPANEYVDIRVDGDLTVTMMEVYDVYGKLVNTVNVIDNPTRINVSTLADGMYFVRVTTEKGAVTKTFVKK